MMPKNDPSSLHFKLLERAREMLPWMVEIRRDLHQHPELGLEEFRTNERIQDRLRELDIPYVSGLAQTGILGTLQGSESGRVVALRADIDGLPIQDAKDVPYKSQIPNRMHACGHDVHTTILLGAARMLREQQEELRGTVKLIFQPAEETVGGAKMLIEEGVLDDPRVEAIFGLHVEPDIPVGEFEVRYGQRNASSDDLKIIIHGRSGHGAYPADAVDAIVVSAHVITALQSIISRNVDAREAAVISLGKIEGGAQANIVANRVEMVGTVRCLDPQIRQRVLSRAKEVAEGVASGLGGHAEVIINPSYDPLINHDPIVDIVRENATALVGKEKVHIKPTPNMGVEDFAYYVSHVPGAFFSLGVRNEERGITHTIHHELFDVDENCLAWGATIQVANVLRVLAG